MLLWRLMRIPPPIPVKEKNPSATDPPMAIDYSGTFADPFNPNQIYQEHPFDCCVDVSEVEEGGDKKPPGLSYAQKNEIGPATWNHGLFQLTQKNVNRKSVTYYCKNRRSKTAK